MATAPLISPIPHDLFLGDEYSSISLILTGRSLTPPIRRRSSREPRPVKRFDSREVQRQDVSREDNQPIRALSAYRKTIKQSNPAVGVPQSAVSSDSWESTKAKQPAKRKRSPENTPSQEPMAQSQSQAAETNLKQTATSSQFSQSSPTANEQHLRLNQPRKASSSPSLPSRKTVIHASCKLNTIKKGSYPRQETRRSTRGNSDNGTIPTKDTNATTITNNKQISQTPATRRSSPRTTNSLAAVSKTKERSAFEAHLRSHDSFGVIRFESNDPIAPANYREHLERIEGMFQHEALMSRLQTAWEQRQQRNKSDKKLWELGKRIPWVLDRFKTFAKYQKWMTEMERRREWWRQDEDRRRALEDHSGDTTEEEEEEELEDWNDVKREGAVPVSFTRIQSLHRFKIRRCQAQHVAVNIRTELYGQVDTVRLSALADVCDRDTGYPC